MERDVTGGGIGMSGPLSAWMGTDLSGLCTVAGVLIGWVVAYQFARRLPRNGSARPTARITF